MAKSWEERLGLRVRRRIAKMRGNKRRQKEMRVEWKRAV